MADDPRKLDVDEIVVTTKRNTERIYASFPLDLAEHGAFMSCTPFLEYRDHQFDKEYNSHGTAVYLPMPSGLAVGYNATWDQRQLGFLGEAVRKGMGAESASDAIKGIGTALVATGVKSLVDMALGDAADAAGVALGMMSNPGYALMFSGSSFRGYTFSYNLIARNENESYMIRYLISIFKYYMSPSRGTSNKLNDITNNLVGSLGKDLDKDGKIKAAATKLTQEVGKFGIISYPSLWEIQFHFTDSSSRDLSQSTKVNDFLFKPAKCALQSFNVDYNSGLGVPAFFKNGAPVTTNITMTFIESEIVTRESIDDPSINAIT